MKLLGRNQITTINSSDNLQVVVAREHGLIEIFAPPAVILGVLVWTCIAQHWIYACFSLIAAFGIAAYWLNGFITKLVVSDHQIRSRGNLHKTFTNEVVLLASEIKSIRYLVGGEHDPDGLYAEHGWSRTCLLPGLNRDEADNIAQLIRRRYPNLEKGDANPNSLLYGDDDGLVTLGLSKVDRSHSETTK